LELLISNEAYDINVVDAYIEANPRISELKSKIIDVIRYEYMKWTRIIEEELVELDNMLVLLQNEIAQQYQIMYEKCNRYLKQEFEKEPYKPMVVKMQSNELYKILCDAYQLLKHYHEKYFYPYMTFYHAYISSEKIIDNEINFNAELLYQMFNQKNISNFPRSEGKYIDRNHFDHYYLSGYTNASYTVGIRNLIDMLDGKCFYEKEWCRKTVQYAILDQVCQTI
jgi:hypothetical protein